MKRTASKVLALALGAVLVLSLLPAVSANKTDLRNIVVGQTQKIMDVTYTANSRVTRTDISNNATRLESYYNGGILPIAYFEYNRIKFPIKGVMMDANGASYEAFEGSITKDFNKLTEGHTVDLNGNLNRAVNRLVLVPFGPSGKRAQALTAQHLPKLLTKVGSEG